MPRRDWNHLLIEEAKLPLGAALVRTGKHLEENVRLIAAFDTHVADLLDNEEQTVAAIELCGTFAKDNGVQVSPWHTGPSRGSKTTEQLGNRENPRGLIKPLIATDFRFTANGLSASTNGCALSRMGMVA